MLEPVIREKYVAAIKASLEAAGLNMSEASRRLGKPSDWVSSLIHRIREGHNLTVDSVRTLRQEAPTLDEHLRAAGWTAGGPQTRGRPAIINRNSQVLRQHRAQLILRRDEIDREIVAITAQIAEVEVR